MQFSFVSEIDGTIDIAEENVTSISNVWYSYHSANLCGSFFTGKPINSDNSSNLKINFLSQTPDCGFISVKEACYIYETQLLSHETLVLADLLVLHYSMESIKVISMNPTIFHTSFIL